MESHRPILTQKDKGTLVKVGLGLLALKRMSGGLIFIVSIGILLAIATIGIIAGLATWLLKYGLLALGIYVIFVLTLRWLHGGDKRRKVSGVPDLEPFESATQAKDEERSKLDAELALARFKAEHMEELQKQPVPPRKP
ncbi:hypothetical protein ACLESO_17615 [Pyxidicoccus sp. 3LG]